MSKVGTYKIDITPPIGIDFIGYHGPITKLLMPPVEETAEQVVHTVVELHKR